MIEKLRRTAHRAASARLPGEPPVAFARRLWSLVRLMRAGAKGKIAREDVRAVTRLLESGEISFGPQARAFEREFARCYGAAHGVCSSSGTAAVHVALAMVGLEPGDEVIVPPITDIGSVLPILSQNAIPIFADVHPESWNLDPAAVEAQIGPRTRAIVAVHLFGNPCDLDGLRAIARRHDLRLIEDCAQAHWASYKGRPIGTLGDAGCFSLQWSKHITTCEGGMTITNDDRYGERGRLFVDKGWNRGVSSDARQYPIFGLNYRLSEMQSALGRSQLARVKTIVERRNRFARMLIDELSGVPWLRFQRVEEGCTHAYWILGLTVDRDAPFTADALAAALSRRRIPAGAHYLGRPIHFCHEPLLGRAIYGSSDLPFSLSERGRNLDYAAMEQPVAVDVLDRLVILSSLSEHLDERLVDFLATETKLVVEQLSTPAKMQSKPSARYKLGVVGCGKIAKEHLESFSRIPDIKVTAVSDVDATALATLATSFGAEARYDDYAEMFEKENLDMVLISVWPKLHAEVAVAAAGAGIRAILCEKPIASSLGEAKAMIEAAEEAGARLVIGHQHRFNPHLVQARELIESGEIGNVHHAWVHFRGTLINNGSHMIDGLLYALGDPRVEWMLGQIHRSRNLADRGQPVEDGSMGLVCLENGVRANVEMGESAVQACGWHFYGDLGSIDVMDLASLRVVGRRHKRPKLYEHVRISPMEDQLRELVACLDEPSRAHRGDASRGYAAMEVVMGLLESARLGEIVRVPVTQLAYPLDLLD